MSAIVLRATKYGVSAAITCLFAVGTLGCVVDVVAPMNSDDCVEHEGQTYCEGSADGQGGGDCIFINGKLYCRD